MDIVLFFQFDELSEKEESKCIFNKVCCEAMEECNSSFVLCDLLEDVSSIVMEHTNTVVVQLQSMST